jgi:hypothetical protein
LIDDATEDDISLKLVNFTKKVSADKARYQQEITNLEQTIQDLRTANESSSKSSSESSPSTDSVVLQETLDSVNGENDEVCDSFSFIALVDVNLIPYSSGNKFSTCKRDCLI